MLCNTSVHTVDGLNRFVTSLLTMKKPVPSDELCAESQLSTHIVGVVSNFPVMSG